MRAKEIKKIPADFAQFFYFAVCKQNVSEHEPTLSE